MNRNNDNDKEKLNLAGVEPITPFSIAELVICAVAAVIGVAYLYTDKISLGFLMPFYCGCFIGAAVMKILHIIKVKSKKPMSFLHAAILVLVSVAITVVTVKYYI